MSRHKKKKHPRPQLIHPKRFRFALITSRFNEEVTRRLHEAAKTTLENHDPASIREMWVPGAWELPFAAQVLADYKEFDAIVALGCIIRGETTHHEHLGREVAHGLMRVSLSVPIAIGFGVLTTDTLEQALDRAGGAFGNKGEEAALSAIEMARLERRDPFDDLVIPPDFNPFAFEGEPPF